MKTIVIVGGIVLAGATMIAVMMDGRNDAKENAPAVQTQSTPGAAPLVSGDQKLNPAHGQPGHRCDLAVGAPLDGSPAPVTTAPSAPAPKINAPSGVKLNPAHGQPGHRCDIEVGAPLT